MKQVMMAMLFASLMSGALAQDKNLVGGAWYCDLGKKENSFFFRSDGSVEYDGAAGHKKGRYSVAGKTLTLTWADGSVERDKLVWVEKNAFKLTMADPDQKNKAREYLFKRVVDEEVVEDK